MEYIKLIKQTCLAENVLIQQALGHSLKHLSICEFMELIKFEKNNVMTDYFGK